jgi:hypothetical protein
MSADGRSNGSGPAGGRLGEEALRKDLQALGSSSLRDLPSVDQTARLLRNQDMGRSPGGIAVKIFQQIQTRPWAATLTVAVVLALILLVIPVSYQKTVGHDVVLKVQGAGLSGAQIDRIASEFRSALRAENIMMNEQSGGPLTFTARVPRSSRAQVDRISQAFVHGLAGHGISATAEATPRVERVLGNLYAYARDNLITVNVSTAGKTDAQIEADIKSQLEAAGLESPEVEYRKQGDQTTLKLMIRKTAGAVDSSSCCPEVTVTLDGHEPGEGQGDGKNAQIRVKRTSEMTDEQVIAQIKQQLRDQGVDADVTMENGQIQVHRKTP